MVVLDDAPSIHSIWQARFDSLMVQDKGITVIHVSAPDEFRKWVAGNRDAAGSAVYLADFELVGFKETGLDLIGSPEEQRSSTIQREK